MFCILSAAVAVFSTGGRFGWVPRDCLIQAEALLLTCIVMYDCLRSGPLLLIVQLLPGGQPWSLRLGAATHVWLPCRQLLHLLHDVVHAESVRIQC